MASPMKKIKIGPGRPKVSDSAKKRKRQVSNIQKSKASVYLGVEIERWLSLKADLRLKTHPELAKTLIDSYVKFVVPTQQEVPGPSTEQLDPVPSAHQVNPVPSAHEVDPVPATHQVDPVLSTHQVDPVPATQIDQGLSAQQRDAGPSLASTPYRQPQTTRECASESSESDSMKSLPSGIDPLSSSDLDDVRSRLKQQKEIAAQISHKVPAGFSKSFVDPFEVSIEVIQDNSSSSDFESDSDEDYEPSFDVTLGANVSGALDEQSFADEVYGSIEEGESDENYSSDEDQAPTEGRKRLETTEMATKAVDSTVHLCYKESLIDLAHIRPALKCQEEGCAGVVNLKDKSVGSALYFDWVCDTGHNNGTWCSQPVFKRGLHAGDLLTSAAILFSGNNYQKVQLMTKFMKLPIVSQASFLKIQRSYLVPAIEEKWKEHLAHRIQAIKDSSGEVVIAGDGRMDSPGHCAQYCTYTAMENSTKEILSVVTVDKRETGKSSVRMEKEGFLRTLQFFLDEHILVKEVITDAHPSITAILRNKHPRITHSYDIWHAAKNLAKKIMKASQKKQCGLLRQWCGHIINHFYHISGESSSVEEFTDLWFGVLHHVVDEHEWAVGRGHCSHGPLSGQHIDWMQKGSPAHDALRLIIGDRRFLKNIPYFLNARSTADLEGFNSLITMYAGKRFAYRPPVYRARNLLAALDHNEHLNRESKTNKDGTVRMAKTFNKKSNRWSVRELKVQKKYGHIDGLLKKVFCKRAADKVGMSMPVVLQESDPRRISSTIATVLPPPKDVLIQEHKSRLSK